MSADICGKLYISDGQMLLTTIRRPVDRNLEVRKGVRDDTMSMMLTSDRNVDAWRQLEIVHPSDASKTIREGHLKHDARVNHNFGWPAAKRWPSGSATIWVSKRKMPGVTNFFELDNGYLNKGVLCVAVKICIISPQNENLIVTTFSKPILITVTLGVAQKYR